MRCPLCNFQDSRVLDSRPIDDGASIKRHRECAGCGKRFTIGVHTPWDVLASLGIAAVLVFGLYPLFKNEERFKKTMPYVVAVSFILALGFVLYVIYMPNRPGFSDPNYRSALKNAYTLFGCTLGLIVVYAFDSMYIGFDTHARWYAQILKFGIGLGIIIGVYIL